MNHIELFAGCGGLSLGLESAGFELLLANELSPMAGETFAYNFFGEDLAEIGKTGRPKNGKALKTKWLSSRYPETEMAQRLRENPQSFPSLADGECDIKDAATLKGSLVIGSIVQLNEWLTKNDDARTLLENGFGAGGVDLVSGGPPCQSFSMAGMRQYNNSRNVLPMEFANFVGMVRPKMALLENVTGILRPFDVEGKKVHAWFEVAKAFVEKSYVPLCLHVNAKLAGVAQNRPRFLMFLFKKEFYEALLPTLTATEQELMLPSWEFFVRATNDQNLEREDDPFRYFDVHNESDFARFNGSFLAPLVAFGEDRRQQFNVHDAIDDLRQEGGEPSAYIEELRAHLAPHIADRKMENHQMRQNSALVKRRFRIYQVLQQVAKSVQKEVQALLAQTSKDLSNESSERLSKFWFVSENGKQKKFGKQSKTALVEYLRSHPTKKQTQKALDPTAPAPAALSIPDDACHYHEDELRTLSVREMARIQSFPDNFAFRSKVTTGGQMRKFEVPQYTQVGNAVPPLLGRALGIVFKDLLSRTAIKPKPKAKNSSPRQVEEFV